ncbi:MAG: isochorismatase family protein [Pirellulales bacterium]
MSDTRAESRPTDALARSPELMNSDDTVLLVVDIQERLLPLVEGRERLVWNVRRLLDAAGLLGVTIAATEQYPEKLGSTVEPLASLIPTRLTKLAFSCAGCSELTGGWEPARHRILVCGMETHVCVAQTTLDLLALGYRVYVPVDAVGARFRIDHETALRRLETSGATLTTTEAAIFEWCRTSGTPEFKKVSALVKESPPNS